MATDGKRSKGRFLYLFDWNAKSRKKLFSNQSESFDAEGSSQGKESADSPATPQYLLELSEHGNHSSFRANGNFSCASSMNGDDGYGTKAPGVVARLMGLDSMPTTSSCEPSSFASYEPRAYPRDAGPFELQQHNMAYGYVATKVEGFSWNPADSRMTKVHGRPLERFQTEVLPPRSAKPISITHHKLLSPIKSPGFVPTKDAAYIMEAAARIIDPAPQPSGRVKFQTLGSSSSSFRIQDLKDKMDAAQRSSRLSESSKTPKTPVPVQQRRGTSSDRSSRKSLFKNIMSSPAINSAKVKKKGKSIPLAVQDRANVQKKDGSVSSDVQNQPQKERKKMKQKEPITQVGPSRTPKKKSSGALRQNNEKQNIVALKDQSTAKRAVSDQQPRKDNYAGPSKIVSKVFVSAENGSKKVITTSVVDQRHALNGFSERRPSLNGVSEKRPSMKGASERKPSLNRMKNISRSKQTSAKDNRLGEKVMENIDERAAQHDLSLQGNSRKDMDVISFTFTSPIKKTGSQSSSTSEAIQSYHRLSVDSCDIAQPDARSSSPPQGLTGTLSLLLEQKIRELTDKFGSTTSDVMMEGPDTNTASCLPESLASHEAHSLMCYEDWSDRDQTSLTCDDDCSSSVITRSSHCWEDVDGEEQSASSNAESHLGHLNIPAPECSMSESQMSSTTSDITHHGNGQPSSPHSQEVISCVSSESVHPREDESDYINASSYWELEYMRCILHYAGLTRLTLDKDYKNIDPGLFDLLENMINTEGNRNEELCSKLERKILFDCVSESVRGKCQRAFFGSYKSWVKWGILLQNEWLTEEVFKEVLCWLNMGNLMVDELVDWDMSTQYGRWIDYEFESLEEGMDIESEIVESLIDELVGDLTV